MENCAYLRKNPGYAPGSCSLKPLKIEILVRKASEMLVALNKNGSFQFGALLN